MHESNENGRENTDLKSLDSLLNLGIDTLRKVRDDKINNKKASLIFTGTNTVNNSIKIGIEANKLGIAVIGGIDLHSNSRLIGEKDATPDNVDG